MSDERNENIVWIDIECTGLDHETGLPLELACVVTDAAFTEKGRMVSLVSHPLALLHRLMPREVAMMHKESGLLRDMMAGLSSAQMLRPDPSVFTKGVALAVLDFQLAKFISDMGAEGATLGGSSAHFDKDWLRKHFPLSFRRLHYRILDVSSVKEQLRRAGWKLETPKKSLHRALPDVLYAIELSKFYQRECFKPVPAEGEVLIPQPEDIPEAKARAGNFGSAPEAPVTPAPSAEASTKVETSSPTKVSTAKPGETKVTVLHEDHKKAPAARGGTRVVVEEAPVATPDPKPEAEGT